MRNPNGRPRRRGVAGKAGSERPRLDRGVLKHILDSVPQGIFWKDRNGVYLGCNEVFARVAGLMRPGEVVGKTDFDLPWPKGEAEAYRADDRDVIESNRPKSHFLEQYLRADGSRRWAEMTKVPLVDSEGRVFGVLGVFEDVTERRESERALRESEAFLGTLLDAIPVPVFYKDREGRYLGFNRAFERFFGAERASMIGKTAFEISPRELAEVYHAKDAELFERGGVQEYESEVENARGVLRHVVFNKALFADSHGMRRGLIGTVLDITKRKQAELMREAVYQIARAADMSRSLDELLAAIHQVVGSIMPARNFYIALLDEADGLIHFPYFADERDAPPAPMAVGSGLTAYVLTTREPLLAGASKLERLEAEGLARVTGTKPAVWLGVPLILEGKVLGVVAVQHYGDPKAFGEADQRLLEFVASEVARAVERKRREEEIVRLNRLYGVLSRTNEMIIRAQTPQELFEKACLIAVEHGLFKLAWVGVPEKESRHLRPAAMEGDGGGYLEGAAISVDDVPEGRGPAGTALRENRRCICRDVEHDSSMAPWRKKAMACGYRSLAAFPLRTENAPVAVFTVYSSETGWFTDAEVRLLEELTADMSFALDTMKREEKRKKAEEDLSLLGTAIEQASEAIIITDRHGGIVYANPAFERISGYERAEVIGRNPKFLKSGLHDEAFYKGLWKTILSGGVWSGRFVNRRKDGRLFTEEGTVSPVRDSSGGLVAFVAVKRDITHELELQRRFERAKNLETVGMIAGGVAHEVRNPLFALSTIVTALEKKLESQPEFGEYVMHIQDQTLRLNLLMNDLLTLGRSVDPKKFVLLDVRTVLSKCKALVSAGGADSSVCRLDLGDSPLQVLADADRLQQVFVNLGQNAISFTPPGGSVLIKSRREGEFARVSVTDEGPGIPEEFLPNLFQPFQTRRQGGTGLGLAIVRQIVAAHGGTVEASNNEPSAGATFTVRLPITAE